VSRLSTTGYVVLGLVSVRRTTAHDLAAFAERAIGHVFSLTRSHVYSELERLGALGLLTVVEVPQYQRPIKRVHEITEQGAETLAAWLEQPGSSAERQRNLFLVRVFFGARMSSERLARLLDDYEDAARSQQARLAQIVESLADRPRARFARATAMFGAAQAQARLHWLDQVRPLLLGEED
jgi:DNA-binding PadR family transcriptional regulator